MFVIANGNGWIIWKVESHFEIRITHEDGWSAHVAEIPEPITSEGREEAYQHLIETVDSDIELTRIEEAFVALDAHNSKDS